jgi:hypothetical protein
MVLLDRNKAISRDRRSLMVKTEFTKVQDNQRREVLRDQNQKPGPLAKYMIGVAIAIVVVLGVGAVLGVAQLLSDDGAKTTVWSLDQELAAIQGNSTVSEVVPKTKEWSLNQELTAIRSNDRASQPDATEWPFEDELAAIRSNRTVHQPEAKMQPTTQQSGPR